MSANIKQCIILSVSLRSRRTKERARAREKGLSPSRALLLSCTHFFQAPVRRLTQLHLYP